MRPPRWLPSFGLGMVLCLLAHGSAQAQMGRCNINTSSVSFGVYDVFASFPLPSTGNIHIRCVGLFFGTPVTVTLNEGNGPNINNRQMHYAHPNQGLSRLAYNLFRDGARTQVWGDTIATAYRTTILLFLLDQNLTVYGLVEAGQDVPAGTYTDTITASINF